MLRVAFQGELGAFSQQAIQQLLGKRARPEPYQWFDKVFAALASKRAASKVDAAVIPIENTLHGSVHENYDLLLKHNFVITAETNVRIVHNLIGPPGMTAQKVRKVYSHPVALNQCLEYFSRHPEVQKEAYYDTAGSVKMIMEQQPEGGAAIASELAAEIYHAKILKKGIEDDRQNYTRFFLLEPGGSLPRNPRDARDKPWKTSLVFSTKNVPGAFFRAMAAFALRDLNLSKIESRPLRGKPWEYLFYVDFIGNQDDPNVRNALSHLGEMADFLRVLGCYRSA